MSILFDSAMFEAIFSILRIGKSLELTMESFRLLNELDKVLQHYFESSIYVFIQSNGAVFSYNSFSRMF